MVVRNRTQDGVAGAWLVTRWSWTAGDRWGSSGASCRWTPTATRSTPRHPRARSRWRAWSSTRAASTARPPPTEPLLADDDVLPAWCWPSRRRRPSRRPRRAATAGPPRAGGPAARAVGGAPTLATRPVVHLLDHRGGRLPAGAAPGGAAAGQGGRRRGRAAGRRPRRRARRPPRHGVERPRARGRGASTQRIVDAAYACMARDGIGAATVEGIAREAGVARATVYRTFPGGRDELVPAAVTRAVVDFFTGLRTDIGEVDDVATLLERGLVAARRRLDRHEVLQRALQDEADQIVPRLATVMPVVVELLRADLAERLRHERCAPASTRPRRPTCSPACRCRSSAPPALGHGRPRPRCAAWSGTVCWRGARRLTTRRWRTTRRQDSEGRSAARPVPAGPCRRSPQAGRETVMQCRCAAAPGRASSRPTATPSGHLVEAALRCIARWGVRKTSLDDIAREAGVSRATAYRAFPGGKERLVEVVLRHEAGRCSSRRGRAAGHRHPRRPARTGISRRLAVWPPSTRCSPPSIEHEPELVLPHFAFHQLDGVLAARRGAVPPPPGPLPARRRRRPGRRPAGPPGAHLRLPARPTWVDPDDSGVGPPPGRHLPASRALDPGHPPRPGEFPP